MHRYQLTQVSLTRTKEEENLVFIVVRKPGEIKASTSSGRSLVMRTVGGIAVAGCVDKTKRKEGNSL